MSDQLKDGSTFKQRSDALVNDACQFVDCSDTDREYLAIAMNIFNDRLGKLLRSKIDQQKRLPKNGSEASK